ncbi:MAG: chromosome segregation protein ScpA [Acidobacteria bacterium]|nr:MAG: chromosome segregation protein ScpA [Acidobacteriota bacterium]
MKEKILLALIRAIRGPNHRFFSRLFAGKFFTCPHAESDEQYTFDFHKETAEITTGSSDELKLKLGEFAGPLDLLLFLIRQEQANIFDIPIAKITDEYVKYIRLMKSLDIAVAADFLVMAATLIEIKSKMLLPRDPSEQEEEAMDDPRKELVDRLLEYEKFKAAAGMLHEKTTVEQAVFQRGKIESDDSNAEINASVFDIITVFQKILLRHRDEIKMEIAREEISLSDMIKTLKRRIFEETELNILAFFEEMHSKRELVTAFIAVLEIVRTESVKLIQKKTFGEIILKAVTNGTGN